MRIPSTIRFPFGHTVRVRLMTAAQMKEIGGAGLDGRFDGDRTIYVRKRLPIGRLRYVLGHELGHAFLDWQHDCFNKGTMKP